MEACPRLIISALRGGAGKTVLSIGIIAAWKTSGKTISPFKKGPDYIDAGWLSLAAGETCFNLDTFLIDQEHILSSFLSHSKGDIAVIEGNRGLYDGIDTEGATSTAELAKLLKTPVILCIDCTKSTRTMAAAVLGCLHFDPDVDIKGVILNRIAGPRHEMNLRRNIEHHCGIPVMGAVPKLGSQNFPERHMGLVPTPEHEWAKNSVDAASLIAKKYLDLDALARVAFEASIYAVSGKLSQNPESESPHPEAISTEKKDRVFPEKPVSEIRKKPIIGIVRDSAFQFYYPENIESLYALDAELVFVSPLSPSGTQEQELRNLDALYIGGGFPETHAEELAENVGFRNELKTLAENGLPIYAECGGLMYLGEELVLDGKSYPMTGVLPVVFGFSKKPQGHGYTVLTVEGKNPYFKVGTEIRGHEFHYSKVLEWRGNDKDLVFSMKRGTGFINNRDGICYKNVLATYTHIHAMGMPFWAEAVVRNAIQK